MTPNQYFAVLLFLGLCVSFFVSHVAAAMAEHCCERERE
jgi:hypothetical protein